MAVQAPDGFYRPFFAVLVAFRDCVCVCIRYSHFLPRETVFKTCSADDFLRTGCRTFVFFHVGTTNPSPEFSTTLSHSTIHSMLPLE